MQKFVKIAPSFFAILLCLIGFYHSAAKGVQQQEQSLKTIEQMADSCFRSADYECALANHRKLLKYYRINGEEKLVAGQYLLIADIFYQLARFDSALFYYHPVASYEPSEAFKPAIARARTGIAHIQWRYGNNYRALENIKEGIALFEQLKDTTELIQAKIIMAGIYVGLQKLEESEKLYNQLLVAALQAKDTAGITTCYEHLGVVAFYKSDFNQAIGLYKQSLVLNELTGKKLEAALNKANLGEAYFMLGDNKNALNYLKESLNTLSTLKFYSGMIFVYYTLGRVYHARELFDRADSYYLKSIDLMNQTGEIRERNYVYQLLSQNFEEQGNYAEALSYHKKYESEKDSLFSLEKHRQFEELNTRYQLEERENENLYLNAKNQEAQLEIDAQKNLIFYQYFISGLILAICVLLLLLYYLLRRTKRKLEIANQTKNRLFNIIAHDVRHPVGNIVALLGLFSGSKSESDKNQFMTMLMGSAKALSLLVENILNWSISNKEGFNFKKEQVNLYDTVEETQKLFIFQINQKNIDLQIDIPKTLLITTDQSAISTIIRNLLSNAIKYTGEKGVIKIWAEKEQDQVTLHVKDNGIGMDALTKEQILYSNNVNSKRGTRNEIGTGIGFTVVKEFIQKLNGTIAIETSPDSGTEMIVSLPQ